MVIVSITPEIAIEGVTSYAGGLGVLEGDKFIAMAKNGVEYLVLSLLYRRGYVEYEVDANGKLVAKTQRECGESSRPSSLKGEEEMRVTIKDSEAVVKPWVYEMGKAKLVLFEVLEPQWLKDATSRLYIDGDDIERIYKWIVLAKASAVYLRDRIGLDKVEVIDLQEAYTTFLLYALPGYGNFRLVIHTPGPWGHPHIPSEVLENEFKASVGKGIVMLTKLALERVSKAFAVSKKHYEMCKALFPEYVGKLDYVTNGVSVDRWRHPYINDLISAKGIENVAAEDLWKVHLKIKRELITKIVGHYKQGLKADLLTPMVVWCRRITRYKRPYFISWFIEDVGKDLDAIFVIGGKPHPADREGIAYAEEFIRLSRKHENVVFIHDYNIQKAQLLLSGGDIHVFTPFPGWEACGTSYMKAALNGVPTLSSRDGGALEMIRDGFNGWLFGTEVSELVNIYDDGRAQDIDRTDYEEFKEKLMYIIKIYGSEEYKRISLNALKTSGEFDVGVALAKYYKGYNLKRVDIDAGRAVCS